MNKVLFIDSTHALLPELLSKAGMNCISFDGKSIEDLQALGDQFIGFIIRSKFRLDADTLRKFPSLRFIGRVGAGMDSIDEKAAAELGIACLNSPEGNRDSVAEHAVGMLLTLMHKINQADAEVREGLWRREANRGFELRGKTVSIIGYGNMGRAFAQRLTGFGVDVLAYDKYKTGYSDAWVKESNMAEVFEKTDILSLHVPLIEETKYLIDDEYLRQFQKNIILINTARGPIVNTEELVGMMKDGKVKGACLDVLEYESVSFGNIDDQSGAIKYLRETPNTILTPHVAGWSVESEIKLARYLSDKIIARFG